MKTLSLSLVAASLVFVAGCQNTAHGVEKDTERNAQEVSQATDKAIDNAADVAQDAGQAVSEAAQNAGAATMLTPRLKTAITADAKLNDRRNTINIDSTDDEVIISGNVMSAELKSHAEAVVKKEMKQASATQKVTNNLEVRANP